jgi:hypothetical protein
VIALLCVSALLAPQVADPNASPVPLSVGTWWEYRESYTEHREGIDSTSDDVTRFAVVSGRLIVQNGGADPVSGPVERGEGWIRLAPWTGEEALPLPLEPGRAGPALEPDVEPWRVEAEEQVSVPAGTFKAMRCAVRTWRIVSVLWIAPGVGVVREVQGVPGYRPEIERVLLRWSGAAP